MRTSYIEVGGSVEAGDAEKTRQFWLGDLQVSKNAARKLLEQQDFIPWSELLSKSTIFNNNQATQAEAEELVQNKNFIPWANLIPANIDKPNPTAFLYGGEGHDAKRIAEHLLASVDFQGGRQMKPELVNE